MGIGKVLGLAVLGVGAVAAAPFTGGGSILGAASLGASLAGAGVAAAGAGAVGVGAGIALSKKEKEKERKREEEIAASNITAEKSAKIISEHEEHTKLILALSALGCSMANADGEISPDEIEELKEYVGGLASQSYPEHITTMIEDMISNPPTFNEAMIYLDEIPSIKYPDVRNILVMVMESDDVTHEKEQAFLDAFDMYIEEKRQIELLRR